MLAIALFPNCSVAVCLSARTRKPEIRAPSEGPTSEGRPGLDTRGPGSPTAGSPRPPAPPPPIPWWAGGARAAWPADGAAVSNVAQRTVFPSPRAPSPSRSTASRPFPPCCAKFPGVRQIVTPPDHRRVPPAMDCRAAPHREDRPISSPLQHKTAKPAARSLLSDAPGQADGDANHFEANR